MGRFRAASWQGVLLSTVAAAAFQHLGYWILAAEIVDRPLDPGCAVMDREASIGIALLVPNPGALADAHARRGIAQLARPSLMLSRATAWTCAGSATRWSAFGARAGCATAVG
jgi:hypothetical protein